MFERQQPGDISMQNKYRFSKFRSTVLAFTGLVAAAAAHADSRKDLGAATPIAISSAQECSNTDHILAKFKYPAGTTFKLTDAGLVVLKQPHKVTVANWRPEWPNTGN
jgi:uncharacterized protein involved in outer membrane biogenesis